MNTVQRVILSRLIPNWRTSWRMASMWCFAATMTVVGVWVLLAEDGAYTADTCDLWLLATLQLLGIAARILAQPGLIGVLVDDLTSPIDDEPR